MARRGQGEGTIRLRPDGRWEARLQVGGRRESVFGKTQKEVREKLATLRKQTGETGSLPERHTLNELVSLWLETNERRWKPRTMQDRRQYADLILAELGGETVLTKLAAGRLQVLVNKYQTTPRKAQLLHEAAHVMLAQAVEWDWLPHNPAARVKRPARPKVGKDWWTAGQAAAFLDATAGNHWWPVWTFALATGCRLGEISALRWTDFDGERRLVRIERSGQMLGGKWVESSPKTRSGQRTLPLNGLALEALRRQRVQQTEWRLRAGEAWMDRGLVFTNAAGNPLDKSRIAETVRRLCKRLALPPATMHMFRHLNASLALQAGAPLPLVSRALGHSSPSITASVYSHAVADGRAVAEAVEQALGAGRVLSATGG